MNRFVLVAIGGGAGSLLRYVAAHAIAQRRKGAFPLGTFLVNVTGCFAIGFLATRLTDPNSRLLLVTGLLGGYTTFSSFEWETYHAVHGGSASAGRLYAVSSVAVGYVSVWLGAALAQRIF